MKERDFSRTSEEQKMSTLMEALTLSENRKRIKSPHDPTRTGSAPPGIETNYLFSYHENDFYTSSFSNPVSSLSKHPPEIANSHRGYSPPKYLPRVIVFLILS